MHIRGRHNCGKSPILLAPQALILGWRVQLNKQTMATGAETNTKQIFLTPNLPCYDPERWGRAMEAYSAESLSKNFQSKAKLTQVERMEIFGRIISYGSSMPKPKPKHGGLKVTISHEFLF